MTLLLKRYPGLTLLGLFAATQLIWFGLAGKSFMAVWSKNPLVADIIKEHGLVQDKAKIVAISYYLPYFEYFTDIVSGAEQPQKEKMGSYFEGRPYIFNTYYQKTVDLFPEVDAAHYMMGFCDYYSGNVEAAQAHYERSVELDPYFFWGYYDLGVIYFQQGDYYKSAVVLSKALALRKEIGLEILRQSPLYKQIWRYLADPPQVLESNLIQGQKDAALLMAACLIKAKGFDQALGVLQSFGQGAASHQQLWEALRQKAASKQRSTDDIDPMIQAQVPVRLF